MDGKIHYLVSQSPQKVFISRSHSLPKQQTFAFAFRLVAEKQMNPLSKNCQCNVIKGLVDAIAS